MFDDDDDDPGPEQPDLAAPPLPPVSRYFMLGDEACRLYAIRPKSSLDAEHPGRLRTTLQPVLRGVAYPEISLDLGWLTPEEVEAYAQYIASLGWEEVPRVTHGLYRQSLKGQMEARVLRLRRHLEAGDKTNASRARVEIRSFCRKHGLPLPPEVQPTD